MGKYKRTDLFAVSEDILVELVESRGGVEFIAMLFGLLGQD